MRSTLPAHADEAHPVPRVVPLQRAPVHRLFRIPDALRLEFAGEVAIARLHLRQRCGDLQFLDDHAEQGWHDLAFGAQAGEHARDLGAVPVHRCIDEAEYVEARGIGDQRGHACGIEDVVGLAACIEQHQLVDFLRGGEQVALDQLGQPLHRLAIGAQALAAQAALDPVGQFVRLDRPMRPPCGRHA